MRLIPFSQCPTLTTGQWIALDTSNEKEKLGINPFDFPLVDEKPLEVVGHWTADMQAGANVIKIQSYLLRSESLGLYVYNELTHGKRCALYKGISARNFHMDNFLVRQFSSKEAFLAKSTQIIMEGCGLPHTPQKVAQCIAEYYMTKDTVAKLDIAEADTPAYNPLYLYLEAYMAADLCQLVIDYLASYEYRYSLVDLPSRGPYADYLIEEVHEDNSASAGPFALERT